MIDRAQHGLFGDVQRRVFDNGLEVLVREDRSAPVAALNFFVRVGSLNEDDSIAGWSHGIEHMLFKGTQRRGPGDIAREIQNAGGETNAGTGYESTNYYITVPSANFEAALDIHADVLRHSTFDEYELEKERQVLIQENSMYRDRPQGFGYTWEALLEEAFTTHRYRRPIGGPDENLLRVGRDAILSHKERYYVPNNITYVVVGDVEANAVFEAMEQKLGDWSGIPLEADRPGVEPLQREFRYRSMSKDVEKAYIKIGFHVPEELNPETDAVLMLAHILASGRTSRLYRKVREEQGLIYDATVLETTGNEPGYLVFELTCAPEKVEPAMVAVFHEILRCREEPVSADELGRTLRSIRSDTVFSLETMEGQAAILGHYALLGDHSLASTYLQRLARVTSDRMLEAARTYLSLEQSTVLVVVPSGAAVPADRDEMARVLAEGLGKNPGEPPRAAEIADAASAPAILPEGSGREREDVETTTLSTGTRVIWQSDGRLPLVALAAYAPAGSGHESATKAGVSQLAQSSLIKGAAGKTSGEIADAFEGLGARFRPFSGREVSGIGLSVTRENFEDALSLWGEVLTSPDFPQRSVEQERERLVAQLRALSDDTVQFTVTRFYEQLFGDHPYGRPVLGTEESLSSLGRESVVAWHRAAYDPSRMVIGVVGDADRDSVLRRLEAILGKLSTSEGAAEIPVPTYPIRLGRFDYAKTVSQAVVVLGGPGPGHDHPDRFALEVWNAILSGMGNRLFTRLRDERHLCYFTGSFTLPLCGGGAVGAYIGTGPEQVEEALEGLREELERSVSDLPTEEEMIRSRNTLQGSLLVDMQTRMSWASTYARDEILGLGHDEYRRSLEAIQKVTAQEVREVAARWIDSNRLTIAVLKPEAAPTGAERS